MKRAQLPIYALALAILIVGLVAVGVPMRTVFFSLAALACPLMMVFMMSGMHRDQGRGRRREPVDQLGGHEERAGRPPTAGGRGGAYG